MKYAISRTLVERGVRNNSVARAVAQVPTPLVGKEPAQVMDNIASKRFGDHFYSKQFIVVF